MWNVDLRFYVVFLLLFFSPFESFSIAFEIGGKCDIDELDLYLKNVQMYMVFFWGGGVPFERLSI